MDDSDRRLLAILQDDASLSVDALAERVGLSRNACWRRVKRLEETGVIAKRVALVDAEKAGVPLTVFVLVRTGRHDREWLEAFERAVDGLPDVVGAYRMSGEVDYVLRVAVASVAEYDAFYQRLIARVPVSDMSASFVMQSLKDTTALPIL